MVPETASGKSAAPRESGRFGPRAEDHVAGAIAGFASAAWPLRPYQAM